MGLEDAVTSPFATAGSAALEVVAAWFKAFHEHPASWSCSVSNGPLLHSLCKRADSPLTAQNRSKSNCSANGGFQEAQGLR